MPKVAVICCVYNAYPVMKRCLDALYSKSSDTVSILLIDNHSPDAATRDYLADCADTSPHCVRVLDPGKNLGTHNGWNYGWKQIKDDGFDYVCKLDDDTVIQTQDWDRFMVRALEARPDIAFLTSDVTAEAKQKNECMVDKVGDLEYEIPKAGIVGFNLVMFRMADMLRWGPMTNPDGDGHKRLYGGEELYLARKARAEGKKIAFLRNVFCEHQDKSERCQDYQLWKYCYGLLRWTDKDLETWRSSGEMLRDLRKLAGAWALGQEGWARQYIQECVRRIGDIGEPRDAAALLLLAHGNPSGLGNYKPRTDMPEIIAECEKSAARLTEKYKK